MTTCSKCGASNPDESYYCQNCGSELKREELPVRKQPSPQTVSIEKSFKSSGAGAGIKTKEDIVKSQPIIHKEEEPCVNTSSNKLKDITNPNNYSLKWHKWMICFVLWLWVLVNIVNFISLIQMKQTALGLVFLAVAIFEIYTCFQLAKFKKGAYEKLMVCLVINCLVTLINLTQPAKIGVGIGQLIVSIAWLIGNWKYYSKRKALFIN